MLIINYNKSSNCKPYITCPNQRQIEKIVTRSADIVGIKCNTWALNLEICTKSDIIKVNQYYRNKNTASNIVSIEYQMNNNYLAGDIFLCHDIIKHEAKKQNKIILDHYYHLIIHGLLHIYGFDHINNHDADIMENIEIKILESFNIKNPY